MRLLLIKILFLFFNSTLVAQGFFKKVIVGGNLTAPKVTLVADINGDGHKDVVTSSATESSLVWYRNINGSLDFDEGRFVGGTITEAAHQVAIDVDNDGDLDIVAAAREGGNNGNMLYWFENMTGTGEFAEGEIFSDLVDNPQFLAVGDLDGDGDIDLASASKDDDKIAWYENEGGSFGVQIILTTTANGAQKVRLADLDNDGDLDVAFCSVNDGQVAWLENRGKFGIRPKCSHLGHKSLFLNELRLSFACF